MQISKLYNQKIDIFIHKRKIEMKAFTRTNWKFNFVPNIMLSLLYQGFNTWGQILVDLNEFEGVFNFVKLASLPPIIKWGQTFQTRFIHNYYTQ